MSTANDKAETAAVPAVKTHTGEVAPEGFAPEVYHEVSHRFRLEHADGYLAEEYGTLQEAVEDVKKIPWLRKKRGFRIREKMVISSFWTPAGEVAS